MAAAAARLLLHCRSIWMETVVSSRGSNWVGTQCDCFEIAHQVFICHFVLWLPVFYSTGCKTLESATVGLIYIAINDSCTKALNRVVAQLSSAACQHSTATKL
jgi:hypothetical protein